MTESIARRALYGISFLLSMHIALTLYFNSSFLAARGVPDSLVGSVYVLGAIANFIILVFSSRILRRFGNYKTLLVVSVLEMLTFIALALLQNTFAVVGVFILSLATATFLFFCFDIVLERYTACEEGTGAHRGLFLTATNLAFVIAPFIAGSLVYEDNFARIYLIAAAFVLPILVLLVRLFKRFDDPVYHTLSWIAIWKTLAARANIRRIFVVQFLLRFFYAAMTIYMPLYLTQVLGYSFAQMGLIFSIMLLPFVLLEYPLGAFADKYWGEKELLVIGFFILICSVALIPLLPVATWIAWAGLLFATRVGAATIEVMNEIYFFKHVDGDDTDTISAFRMLRPAAYIIGPALGTLVLIISDMRMIFSALAVVLISGVIVGVRLKDTV